MAANQTVSFYGTTPFTPTVDTIQAKRPNVFGLGFPLGKDKLTGGFFSNKSGLNLIKDAVIQLLKTERGERVMLPNFGCNLRKYLFQPLDETTFENIKNEIRYSFENYIVGARLVKVRVVPLGDLGPAGGNSLLVSLVLRLVEDDLTVFDVEVTVK